MTKSQNDEFPLARFTLPHWVKGLIAEEEAHYPVIFDIPLGDGDIHRYLVYRPDDDILAFSSVSTVLFETWFGIDRVQDSVVTLHASLVDALQHINENAVHYEGSISDDFLSYCLFQRFIHPKSYERLHDYLQDDRKNSDPDYKVELPELLDE